jgi:hypothetical protein
LRILVGLQVPRVTVVIGRLNLGPHEFALIQGLIEGLIEGLIAVTSLASQTRRSVVRSSSMIFTRAGLFLAALLAAAADIWTDITVSTEYGAVHGHPKDGAYEFQVRLAGACIARVAVALLMLRSLWLQGIPYAKPPVGELRFAAPQKANPYSGTYEANFEAPGCPQICNLPPGNCPLSTSEDCLYVSVFTPQQPDTTNYPDGYPVYFWIHGGAFEQGLGDCALYNGTKLAQKGMVVVAIK